ncbi:MAG: threonine--tRNA ligase [Thermodesulfobacteriota bacterium]
MKVTQKIENEVTVSLPDDCKKTFSQGITAAEVFTILDKKASKKNVAVKIDGELRDLSEEINEDCDIQPVTMDSKEGLNIYRHSTSHMMAQAVKELFTEVKLGIGPTIEDGFYYDFDMASPLTLEDLDKIENKMKEIVRQNNPFIKESLPKEEALKLFEKMGETYKLEIIKEIPDETVTVYRQGNFVDLCRGPHLLSTGRVKAFKLTSLAGAYWRGNEKNKMLQRVYATAFAEKHELKQYLQRIEEAKKRDHRKLGKELDLFSISDDIGPGLICWHPKGALIRHIIEEFWKTEHLKKGYDLVYTPHIAKADLWKKSGHWEFYRENLYSPMDVDGSDYIVKPMNCPFHINIYKSHMRSYRELPIRYAELGTVYRYERSGVLHGLLRVRGFTQDDAHIYCRHDQLENEIKDVLKLTLYMLRYFGFHEFDIYLSTRPEHYVGELDDWEKATEALERALTVSNLSFQIDPGEGVFYGPKIDIKIKDSLGRLWQCSTIQVDFNLPQRFEVTYINSDSVPEQAIMIHRALMGSLERFFGCLIEHYGGAFPLWLAPVQVILLTISEEYDEYAGDVSSALKNKGFRVEVDLRREKLGFKIREAQLQKIPYMVVLGEKEMEQRTLAPRSRSEGPLPAVSIDEFIDRLNMELNEQKKGGEL